MHCVIIVVIRKILFYCFILQKISCENSFFIQKDILLHHHFKIMITDLKYLQQMTDNNGDVMKEMIELFLHQLTEMQVDLELVANNKNWLELSRLAHKIKSSALVMGIEQMADDMKELEFLAKEGKSIEKYIDYIARFKTMAELTEIELRTYLESGNYL